MRVASRRECRREARGAAAVELALILPILMWVLIGIMNLGFVFSQQIGLTNGARQAVRMAVVSGPTCAEIADEAQRASVSLGMEPADVPPPEIAPACGDGGPCAGSAAGTNVTVTLTKEADWMIPYLPPFSDGTAPTLVAEGVMRCEFS